MNGDFLQTIETIPPDRGFSYFGGLHLVWLAAFVLITVVCSLWYRRMNPGNRKVWKWTIAGLLLADELFKFFVLLAGGYLSWFYLPLHLCSINIFLISWHAVRPHRHLGCFLYAVCIPGALIALLFPAWNLLPITSAMHIHSFTSHILLALYPIVLTAAGEIRPTLRQLPVSVGILLILAGIVYFINRLLGTNFMFLMYAEVGSPLAWFAYNWGSHLWGFPVIAAGVWFIMYLPLGLGKKSKKFN